MTRKGDVLERAVVAIEETILRSSPSLQRGAFRIECKKLIVSEGVKHEIDIWVSVEIAKGYTSIFIFECKNWEEKVGKNEVIVFSEKIKVASAQKGFFVGKSFTKDGLSQAAKDDRIEVITAEDLPVEGVPVPFDLHFIVLEQTVGSFVFRPELSDEQSHESSRSKVNRICLNGVETDVSEATKQWQGEIWNERSKAFPSGALPAATYTVTAEGTKTFEADTASVDGRNIAIADYDLEFRVRVVRPAIVSIFEVGARGRALELSPVEFGAGLSIEVIFAQAT